MSTADSAEVSALRETVCALHGELVRNNLVAWTSGNVSARLGDLMVIRPSGISYDDLTPESMVVCDLDGEPLGGLSPSSDTATHAYIYRHMPEVGGVVHTHSTYATAWAARGRFARLPLAAASSLMAKGYGYAAEGDVLTACLVAAGPAPRGDEPGPPRRRLEGVLPAHRHRIRPGLGREEHDRGPLPAVSRGFVSTMMTRPFGVGLVGPGGGGGGGGGGGWGAGPARRGGPGGGGVGTFLGGGRLASDALHHGGLTDPALVAPAAVIERRDPVVGAGGNSPLRRRPAGALWPGAACSATRNLLASPQIIYGQLRVRRRTGDRSR